MAAATRWPPPIATRWTFGRFTLLCIKRPAHSQKSWIPRNSGAARVLSCKSSRMIIIYILIHKRFRGEWCAFRCKNHESSPFLKLLWSFFASEERCTALLPLRLNIRGALPPKTKHLLYYKNAVLLLGSVSFYGMKLYSLWGRKHDEVDSRTQAICAYGH